jgi:hypothetical protein
MSPQRQTGLLDDACMMPSMSRFAVSHALACAQHIDAATVRQFSAAGKYEADMRCRPDC